jgi:hypothetical protein
LKAFEEGRSAFLVGQVGNPYQINTNKYKEWERGWNREYFDNLEKVKQDEAGRGG